MAPCTYEIPPGYEHEILELPSEYGKRKQINQDSTWQLQTVPCFKPVDYGTFPCWMSAEWALRQQLSSHNFETKALETDKAHLYCDIVKDLTHIWMQQTNQKINFCISPWNSLSFSILLTV